MAADLIVLEPEDQAADLEALLTRVLAKVRAGEVSSIAVAYVYRDGRSGQTWSEAPNFAALLGSVSRLEHKMQVGKDDEDAAAG